jgi:hypothetical protein
MCFEHILSSLITLDFRTDPVSEWLYRNPLNADRQIYRRARRLVAVIADSVRYSPLLGELNIWTTKSARSTKTLEKSAL